MKDIVSFETANRLKEAGFPQPVFDVGQIWYDVDSQAFWVKCTESQHIHGEWLGDDHSRFIEIPHGDEVFAPTATDILPPDYCLCREISYKTASGERWVVYDRGTRRLICPTGIETDNSAEACAEAWLKLNAKP